MKTVLAAILGLVLSSSSYALVSDGFQCELRLRDIESGEMSIQTNSFNLTRKQSSDVTPEYSFTRASGSVESRLESAVRKVRATFDLTYYHATPNEENGFESKQTLCISSTIGWCRADGVCPTLGEGCFYTPDVNSSIWANVKNIPNARIPEFAATLLRPAVRDIYYNGSVRAVAELNCTHTGTFYDVPTQQQ